MKMNVEREKQIKSFSNLSTKIPPIHFDYNKFFCSVKCFFVILCRKGEGFMETKQLEFKTIKKMTQLYCLKDQKYIVEVETTNGTFIIRLVFLKIEKNKKIDFVYQLYAPNMTKKSKWILKKALYQTLSFSSLKENERRVWLDQNKKE